MKILYYSPHPYLNLANPAGYATHMREIIGGFRKLGNQVVTFICGGEKMTGSLSSVSGSRSKSLIKFFLPRIIWESIKDFAMLKRDERSYQNLNQQIIKEHPDLIYERGYYLLDSGYKAAKQNGIKYYLELNAPYLEEKMGMEGKSFYSSRASRKLKGQLQYASKVIVVSSALKKYYVENYDVQPDKIIVTPNAFNPDALVDFKKVNNQTKEKLTGKRVIGFVGSIFPWHGVDDLIHAFFEIQKKHADVFLIIVGDGETLPELKNMVSKLKLQEKVLFTGNIPPAEVFGYIETFDIAVMAKSNWYGSPVKIFEYGAMKKAIVAPDTLPVRDVFENGKDGLLVNNPEELQNALEKLLSDRNFARSCAESFFTKVNERHTWLKMSELILSN